MQGTPVASNEARTVGEPVLDTEPQGYAVDETVNIVSRLLTVADDKI